MNDETAKYVRIMFIISGNPHVHIVMIFIALHFSILEMFCHHKHVLHCKFKEVISIDTDLL